MTFADVNFMDFGVVGETSKLKPIPNYEERETGEKFWDILVLKYFW